MSKLTGGQAMIRLLTTNPPPPRGGVWLDCYNNIWNEEISGAITTRVDAATMFFVTELTATDGDEPAAATRQAK